MQLYQEPLFEVLGVSQWEVGPQRLSRVRAQRRLSARRWYCAPAGKLHRASETF